MHQFLIFCCLTLLGFVGALAPGTPTIGWGDWNFSLVDINHSAITYKDLVKSVNKSVDVTVTWEVWTGGDPDIAKVYVNKQVIWKGDPTPKRATFPMSKAGKYEFYVEICNADGCANTVTKPLIIADTDGGHLEPMEQIYYENNLPFKNKTGKAIATYFVEWSVYNRKYTADNIPFENLTHILYGFIPICGGDGINDSLKQIDGSFAALQRACAGTDDFKVAVHDPWAALQKPQKGVDATNTPYKGNFGQLMMIKRAKPDIKILPSIGGWTLSDPFFFFHDEEKRSRFIYSVSDFLQTWKFFDGVDIDWEHPGGGGAHPTLGDKEKDGQLYITLMKELREMLDDLEIKMGKHYILTSAINIGYDKLAVTNYGEAQRYMDNIFMMSYDFYGAWDFNVLGHQTAIYAPSFKPDTKYTINKGLKILLNQGVLPEKLVLGVAKYGRGWTGVHGFTEESPLTGKATGAILGTWEPGVLDYRHIVNSHMGAGWEYIYDSTAEAPLMWKPSTGDLITYDDPESVKAKGRYCLRHGLGGLMSWEIDADNGDLLNAMHVGLGNLQGGVEPENREPVAIAGSDFDTVGPKDIVLDGSKSYDPEDDILKYLWTQESGPAVTISNASSAISNVTFPAVTEQTTYTFKLTVTDPENLSGSDTITITSKLGPNTENQPPVAVAGSDVQVVGPATVQLNGSHSNDSEGAPLIFSWTQEEGPTIEILNASAAVASISLPEAKADIQYTFRLTVTDSEGLSASDSMTVTNKSGTPQPNRPPKITAPAEVKVRSKQQFEIQVDAEDAEGQQLSFSWDIPSAFEIITRAKAVVLLRAPSVNSSETFNIGVTVSDGELNATANIRVNVSDKESNICNTTDPEAGKYPFWSATSIYTNEMVSHAELVWQAKYWNQGVEPARDSDAWLVMSKVELPWLPTVAYDSGSHLNHSEFRWRAKWWNKGEEPGVSSTWENVGPATCTFA